MSAIPSIRAELLRRLENLSPEAQNEVLEFARSLYGPSAESARSSDGASLLQFAGLFSREDVEEMERIIEEGCEQVDEESWK